MKYFVLFFVGAILGYFGHSYNMQTIPKIPNKNLVKKVSQPSLLTRLLEVEKRYFDYVEVQKSEIEKVYHSKNVQKLRRGPLRKLYSYETKADSKQATLRYSFYTVKESKGKLETRAVFDDFRSKMLWDRLIKVMAKQAFLANGEKVKESEDKMNSMISMVMKDSGLSQIQNRSEFHHLELLGDNVLVFWDSIYKKCSQKKRKELGIQKCVKGLFIGEIDLKNTVRDFYLEHSNENLGWAEYTKSKGLKVLSHLYPTSESKNLTLYTKLNESQALGVPLFFNTSGKNYLVYPSQKQANTIIYLKE
ncbi:MAG: hypothetical protein KC646_03095 [Candidatus Cloacimonetes bacterium]|nr:hypothetical protein [Candidatus Cloacimonadota bacterium]